MITQALRTILKEEHGYTEEGLQRRIESIDLTDGKLDGRVAKTENPDCPQCGRKLMGKKPLCLYCGAIVVREEPINLPKEFAVNGLRVRVSAKIRDDMASINMYGMIIEIIEISKL
jgi:hypothetical protein